MFIGGILLDLGSVFGAALVGDTVPLFCIEDNSIDGRERGDLCLGRAIGPLGVGDARTIHRPLERMNRSSSSLWNLTARPGPAGVSRPSRTALHKVTGLILVYCAASS